MACLFHLHCACKQLHVPYHCALRVLLDTPAIEMPDHADEPEPELLNHAFLSSWPRDEWVRRSALELYVRYVEQGLVSASRVRNGESAIQVVMRRLRDPQDLVRRSAVLAVPRLYERGDQDAITALAVMLEDEVDLVRLEAARQLPAVAAKDDEFALAEVSRRLQHCDASVRRAAVEALAWLSNRGCNEALKGITPLLQDRHAFVRRAAIRAVAQVAERGDLVVTSKLQELCDHEKEPEMVRTASRNALAHLVASDNPRI